MPNKMYKQPLDLIIKFHPKIIKLKKVNIF